MSSSLIPLPASFSELKRQHRRNLLMSRRKWVKRKIKEDLNRRRASIITTTNIDTANNTILTRPVFNYILNALPEKKLVTRYQLRKILLNKFRKDYSTPYITNSLIILQDERMIGVVTVPYYHKSHNYVKLYYRIGH